MYLNVRAIRPEDVDACGRIMYEAHQAVANVHGFRPEQPSPELAISAARAKLRDPNACGLLVEREGRIIGSVFVNFFPRTPVAAIGPLTVVPDHPGGAGRELMLRALEEASERGYERMRLVQSPNHIRSLGLYVKLGFTIREPLLLVAGELPATRMHADRRVRPATAADVERCNDLCTQIHGFAREHELLSAIDQNVAYVAEGDGRLAGYAAGIGFRGHAVARTGADLLTLIRGARNIVGPGFFVPARNGEILRRLFSAGLRALWPANLMTLGPYEEPVGAFLPSGAF